MRDADSSRSPDPAPQPRSRRAFLGESAGALAAFAGLTNLDRVGPGAGRLTSVGLQLYTVRDEMQKNIARTLERVAKIGYKEVEFAGYFGKSPAEVRSMLKANGLTAPSSHIDLTAIRTKWPATIETARQIGHRYLVCAYIPEEERTLDGYKRIFQDFNRAAEQAKKAGISFAYHNHDFEFKDVDHKLAYDLLLEETDPKLVLMELDLYWITVGKEDPLGYFGEHPGRFPMVHVKDMVDGGKMTDVGSGKIPFAKYFAQQQTAGIKHFFVERDDAASTGDAFGSIEKSFRYLNGLEF
jgi:sugar phosphate isomerase/epimerase